MHILPTLHYQKENIIGGNVGIRPYRIGGVRLESKVYHNKIIYHNYGHGGAGISLGPGYVMKSLEEFRKINYDRKNKPIAIIGSGYIGLLTAKILSDNEYNVRIYSDKFPRKNFIFSNIPCITSLSGGGYWMPFGVEEQNIELFKIIQILSWKFYQNCIKNNVIGVNYRNAYYFNHSQPRLNNIAPYIQNQMCIEKLHVVFEQCSKAIPTTKLTTLSIDTNYFLNDMYQYLKRRNNINFISKKFLDIDEVLNINEEIIFNCSGNGSKQLFSDNNLIPIRGQIMYLSQQPKHDFFLFAKGNSYNYFAIYPLLDKIAVGITYEKNNELLSIDDDTFQKFSTILDNFYTTVKP